MLKFKKQFETTSIVLMSGLLIDKNSIGRESSQKALKGNTSFAYMFDEVEGEPEATQNTEPPAQPGTGGGGAGDPRPKPTSTKKKADK